jgi:hypothetical protein
MAKGIDPGWLWRCISKRPNGIERSSRHRVVALLVSEGTRLRLVEDLPVPSPLAKGTGILSEPVILISHLFQTLPPPHWWHIGGEVLMVTSGYPGVTQCIDKC